MDFDLALISSGWVTFFVLLISLAIYFRRTRAVAADVTPGTTRALYAYAFAGLGMAIATMVGMHEPLRWLITSTNGLFLGSILFAQMWILFPDERARKGATFVIGVIGALYVDNILRYLIPTFPIAIMAIGLTILLTGSFYFSVVLIRENPSTFTISLFLILCLYLLTFTIAATGWIFVNPEFYILQSLPLILAASIFASVQRPWRTTITLLILILLATVSLPILYTAFISGESIIWLFVLVSTFTTLCLIAPLNYFVQQATETKAKTPMFLGLVVAMVALLVIIHELSWAVYQTNGATQEAWNQYIIWIEVIIGATAVAAFINGGVSASFGTVAYSFSREFTVVFGTGLAILSFPPIQETRWTNDPLWLSIGLVVVLGFVIFTRVSFRINKGGAKKAARTLMLFVVSTMLTAVVTMYSDDIPFGIVIVGLIIAAFLALASSPPVMSRISKAMRSLEELEEYGVEEDGYIRW